LRIAAINQPNDSFDFAPFPGAPDFNGDFSIQRYRHISVILDPKAARKFTIKNNNFRRLTGGCCLWRLAALGTKRESTSEGNAN
jgi:hypothetical protein